MMKIRRNISTSIPNNNTDGRVLRSTGHESREPMNTPVKPFTNSLILKV